jgi:hypothetical protein
MNSSPTVDETRSGELAVQIRNAAARCVDNKLGEEVAISILVGS